MNRLVNRIRTVTHSLWYRFRLWGVLVGVRTVLKSPFLLRWMGKFVVTKVRASLASRVGGATVSGLDHNIVFLQAEIEQGRESWEDHLALGQLLVQRRRYFDAQGHLEHVIADVQSPASAKIEAQLWIARSYDYAGHLVDAERAYSLYLAEFTGIGSLERRRIERRIADLRGRLEKSVASVGN